MIHVHPHTVLQVVLDRHDTLRREAGASRLRRPHPHLKRQPRHRHREVTATR
jgi:hypothetical protein